jgi:uncharacterized repeat protein (TIGR03803 family)
VLHHFRGDQYDDGENPEGNLVCYESMLYGMTEYGGSNDNGVVFSIGLDGSSYALDHVFGSITNDGRRPRASLAVHGDSLYGLTPYGGLYNEGVAFKYTPGTEMYAILHHFGSSNDAATPYGSLIVSDGRLYGMGRRGGTNNQGAVFAMDPDGGNYDVLYSFGTITNDGYGPSAQLLAVDDRLYGMTPRGGTGVFFYSGGTIFSIDPDGSDYRQLHAFDWEDREGFFPMGSLISDGSRLYGMASYGGGEGIFSFYYGGTIFSISTEGTGYNTLHRFAMDMESGLSPEGDLLYYANAFYGMTAYGGTHDDGVIFRFQPRMACPDDFDGDGRTDPGVFRQDAGMWYVDRSSDGLLEQQWGWNEAFPVPGDYDGDGTYDVAFYWPHQGMWYLWQSTEGVSVVQWGWTGAVPVPADYDNDFRTDIAVYAPDSGNWYILQSGSGELRVSNWGWDHAVPVPADYDGDQFADVAVYWPESGYWFILYSSGGGLMKNWGWVNAQPVPGDYDGDGRDGIAVHDAENSNWYLLFSDGGSLFTSFGPAHAIPVPGRYDSDNRTDLAAFDQDHGLWTMWLSDNGTIRTNQLGDAATPPIPVQHWINRWFGF